MSQAALDLEFIAARADAAATEHRPADVPAHGANPAGSVDRTGFEIGWDHAQRGLVPPAELLLNGSPVCQGWLAGKATFGRRVLSSSRPVRAWLALRIVAWRQGIAFDLVQVTPHCLAQIDTKRCPVLRRPLGGAPGEPDAAVIVRINPQAGYAAGNLAVISQRAVLAMDGVGALDALRRAHRIDAGEDPLAVSPQALDAAAWRRLAALRSFTAALAFHDAARLPLAMLPPNRVRVLNAAQGLQALLTLQFAAPGWASRTRAIANLLPEHTLRHDFNLFVGAIAPRVLEAAVAGSGAPRQALEDAWLNERVQRRWQHLVLSLGEAATATLLERATAKGLTGMRTLNHVPERATEGWGLAQRPAERPAAEPALVNAGGGRPASPWPRQRRAGVAVAVAAAVAQAAH